VSGCTSNLNHHHGITYNTGCFIVGNTAADNTGSGLVGTGINNTVDGNKAYKNHAPGIVQSAADADFTFRNVSNQNTTAPYSPVTSGSFFGPYSQPGTATSPWANF
jgi:hypothetical protein